jgi:hypothetical protein
VKKAQEHYHFDWSTVPEPGPRFENPVACDAPLRRGLRYLQHKLPEARAGQISATGKDYQRPEGIRVAPALELLRGLV